MRGKRAPSEADPNAFDGLTERLRERLLDPLPGTAAHLGMAPGNRLTGAQLTVEEKRCREAAVLVLLVPIEGTAHVVLTLRPSTLRHHPGQISFPGGRREAGETPLETALREAEEEIGVAGGLDILGSLSPLYIPPSNFCMQPFVARLPERPVYRPHDREVEAVLEVPLGALVADGCARRTVWQIRGEEVEIPHYRVGPHRIWGATAMVLAELLEIARIGDIHKAAAVKVQ